MAVNPNNDRIVKKVLKKKMPILSTLFKLCRYYRHILNLCRYYRHFFNVSADMPVHLLLLVVIHNWLIINDNATLSHMTENLKHSFQTLYWPVFYP